MGRELAQVLIDGQWVGAREVGAFRAYDPRTGVALPARFPLSGWGDLDQALDAAHGVVPALEQVGPRAIARFLDRYAEALLERGEELALTAERETALPARPRLLEVELPRTVDQLHQAARAAAERSWSLPTIDRASNIRSLYVPLGGPVVIFGPSNFPLAFNAVAGGDFAAAIAAGNPVIAKGHPLHPATTRLLAEIAAEQLESAGLPAATVQMVFHMEPDDGIRLASDPRVGALAYTGSRAGGLTLKAAADRAGVPAFLEMGSLNPVVILPGALRGGLEALATELATSALLAVGQLCTKPGLLLCIDCAEAEDFIEQLAAIFEDEVPGCLLSEPGLVELEAAVGGLVDAGAEKITGGLRAAGLGIRFENTLLRVEGRRFLDQPSALQLEAFGNAMLVVVAADAEELDQIVCALSGSLAGSLYSSTSGADDDLYRRIAPLLARRVGRLLNDKVPTGVAVVPAMVQGGPYPATGHPGFTAVGFPASIRRFARPLCFDNVRQARLPLELRDSCPIAGLSRLVNGRWVRTPG